MKRVAALPPTGTSNSYAKLLGLTPTTLRNWALYSGLPFTQEGAVRVITRDALIQWLVTNNRFEKETS
ncbi:MAG: helix-turn-helix domain-containing protein [Acidipila sp.]|nr:helix-turn-helix domain-containing protein [Acidipila sp.]